jgi:hypothetical protein
MAQTKCSYRCQGRYPNKAKNHVLLQQSDRLLHLLCCLYSQVSFKQFLIVTAYTSLLASLENANCKWKHPVLPLCLSLVRQSPVGQGLLNQEVSRSHITTHHSRYGCSGRVISSSQRPLPDNTQPSRQTSMPSVGFEPTISAGKRTQTYALDRAANGTGVTFPIRTQNSLR